ncbi:MAG: hypothetical protein ACXV8P_04155 [Methylobacter sp.]
MDRFLFQAESAVPTSSWVMQEQLPTTARMQEVEQCRSNCREQERNYEQLVVTVYGADISVYSG